MNLVSGKENVQKLRWAERWLSLLWSTSTTCSRGWYRCMEFRMICTIQAHIHTDFMYVHICTMLFRVSNLHLTWPLSSRRLLVSLRRSNETVCFIHWAPRAGESGWKCTLPGIATSPRPAISHEELWKAYLQRWTQRNHLYLSIFSPASCRGLVVPSPNMLEFSPSDLWII